MATDQATFDAYITNTFLPAQAARDAAVLAAITEADTALANLVAKVQSGAAVIDLTAELTQLQTLTATAQTIATNAAALTQTATADDPGPTAVPATPVAAAATTESSGPTTGSAAPAATTPGS